MGMFSNRRCGKMIGMISNSCCSPCGGSKSVALGREGLRHLQLLPWLRVECITFAVPVFIWNGESKRPHKCDMGCYGAILDGRIMCRWVSNIRQTGSAFKRKSAGQSRTVITLENMNAVRLSVQLFPSRSACKQLC